jgi:hypothetical protein
MGKVATVLPMVELPGRTSMTAKKSSSFSSLSPANTNTYGDPAGLGIPPTRGVVAQALMVAASNSIMERMSPSTPQPMRHPFSFDVNFWPTLGRRARRKHPLSTICRHSREYPLSTHSRH